MLNHDGPLQGKVIAAQPDVAKTSYSAAREGCLIVDSSSIIMKAFVPLEVSDIPRDMYGRNLTEAEFKARTVGGCCVCSDTLVYGMDEVHWDHDAPFCIDCWESFDIEQGVLL